MFNSIAAAKKKMDRWTLRAELFHSIRDYGFPFTLEAIALVCREMGEYELTRGKGQAEADVWELRAQEIEALDK